MNRGEAKSAVCSMYRCKWRRAQRRATAVYCAVAGEMETAGASVGEQRSMAPRLVGAAAQPNSEQFDSD